jgi:hypothetical protein
MPNFPISVFYPTAPLNWISILHYLILLATVYMLITAGEKTPLLYIMILGLQALMAGASLYVDKVSLAALFVFLARVGLVAIPAILAGWSPTENTRAAGVVTAILGAPILAMTFLSCNISILADPRILNMGWCGR